MEVRSVEGHNRRSLSLAILTAGLFLSGGAGLINQVVWQRALKVYLGGSETISSMIVVLVFMAGLGAGSVCMVRKALRILNPAKTLARIEASLGIANFAICFLLSLDLTKTVYFIQSSAIALGIPLRALYAFGSALVLTVPCFLMGTTLPLAAEVCQRQLGMRENRSVSRLYFFNTLGAVLGALLGLGTLMPNYGQRFTLSIAASLNVLVAFLIYWITAGPWIKPIGLKATGTEQPREALINDISAPAAGFAILAFGFGFCSLWYEMLLYRGVALRHQPLPLVFSAVLTGFLLFWSLGILASSLRSCNFRLTYVIFGSALSGVGSLLFFAFDSNPFPLDTLTNEILFILTRIPYFLPCLFSGMLFGLLIKRAVIFWGSDLGRLSGWNTFGSCSGILLATFVGYEMNPLWMLVCQWLLLLALGGVSDRLGPAGSCSTSTRKEVRQFSFYLGNPVTIFFVLLTGILGVAVLTRRPVVTEDGSINLFGRDGVIIIDQHGNLAWDGLWHSRLSRNNDHVGTYNWALGVEPILAHPTGLIKNALVIGMGSGITAATIAKLDTVISVDVYDIDLTLKTILELYPNGTLNVAKNPKIHLHWQDGRSGLALHGKKYDLITQQPLYLKQAGASILLSKEYMALVSERLNENGVFCVYANGTPEQALAVRQTASEIFPFVVVLHNGYQVLVSRSPLEFSRSRIERFIKQDGELQVEIRTFFQKIGDEKWAEYLEPSQLALAGSEVTIRDDFPIVEYPRHLRKRLDSMNFTTSLPWPDYNWATNR